MRNKLPYKLPLSIAAAVVAGALLSPVVGASDIPVATWTGAAGTNLFSTAGNWKEGKVPANGAMLMLPCSDSMLTLKNDLSNVKFAGIETATVHANKACSSMSIDTINFNDSITLTSSGSGSAGRLELKKVTGAAKEVKLGTDTKNQLRLESSTAVITTEHLTAFSGGLDSLSVIKPTKSAEAEFAEIDDLKKLDKGVKVTVSNLTMNGDSYAGDITLREGGSISAYGGSNELSGVITLLGDVTYYVNESSSLKLSGSINGKGFKLLANDNSSGAFENATKSDNSDTLKGQQKFQEGEVDLKKQCAVKHSGGQRGEYIRFVVIRNQSGTLRDDLGCGEAWADIALGGRLKGNGTVKVLKVNGILAPGNSPGSITVKEFVTFRESGVFDVELLNKTTYDKVIAGKNFAAQYSGNAVEIKEGATLKLSYLPNGIFKKGDVLTIIDNQSKTPVKGIFKDLPEGAEVRVGSATFMISYKGGDGNDVTLTAQNDSAAPKAPNTGVARLVTSPVTALAAGVAAVVALFAVSKRRVANKR